ncbi:hypothetical protein ACQP1W_26560 [Spirillospora sp. CA-255316]
MPRSGGHDYAGHSTPPGLAVRPLRQHPHRWPRIGWNRKQASAPRVDLKPTEAVIAWLNAR